jgi:hypothetical protein
MSAEAMPALKNQGLTGKSNIQRLFVAKVIRIVDNPCP